MLPDVVGEVDQLESAAGHPYQRFDEGLPLSHERDDAPIVIGIGLDIEHGHPGDPPGLGGDPLDVRKVPALGEVGNGLEDHGMPSPPPNVSSRV